jgi:uncharacterized membrane protein
MDDPLHSVSAKPRPIWRWVLIGSLALNLAVVGMLGGALVSGRFGDGPQGRVDLGLGPFARAMADDDRRAIGRQLRQMRDLRAADLRAPVQAMAAALRADPFDPAQLAALMAAQADALAQVQGRAQSVVLARIAAMTPAQRADFADRLEQELRHGRGSARSGG